APAHAGTDRVHGRGPPPRPDRTHPRRLRRRPPGVLGLHDHRRVRRSGRAGRAGDVRRLVGRASRAARGPRARTHEGRGEAGRDARIQGRRLRPAGGDHRDRGRCRRAQCLADGDRERRTAGACAAAPAARAGGAGQRGLQLRAALPGTIVAHRARAPGDDARNRRRLRHRRKGPRAAWSRRTAGHAPDRPGRVPRGRPCARRGNAAAGARARRRAVAGSSGGGRRPGRALGRRGGPVRFGLIGDNRAMDERIPLLIDTDPGVDDALALLMAFADPRHEVVGLTIAAGNVGLQHTVANALKLCEVLGRDDVPVFAGCDRPLLHPAPDAANVHGRDGFGDVGLAPATRGAEPRHAAEAIIELSHRYDGRLLLVALGPLTNVALALRLDPTLPSRVARLVVMGGAVTGRGNITPSAEFNVFFDPEAAHIVFEAFERFDLCDWEATIAHGFLHADVERWLAAPGPVAAFYEAV